MKSSPCAPSAITAGTRVSRCSGILLGCDVALGGRGRCLRRSLALEHVYRVAPLAAVACDGQQEGNPALCVNPSE